MPQCVSAKWREENSVIYFSVTPDGTTGEEWIPRLEDKGYDVGSFGERILRSKDFTLSKNIVTEIAVLRSALFPWDDRTTENIRFAGALRNFVTPNCDIACLIREMFTKGEFIAMRLQRIVTMHEPHMDSLLNPELLGAYDSGGIFGGLSTYIAHPGTKWTADGGSAFVVPSH